MLNLDDHLSQVTWGLVGAMMFFSAPVILTFPWAPERVLIGVCLGVFAVALCVLLYAFLVIPRRARR